MMSKVCNMCGKPFSEWDKDENRCLHDTFGYGSKHDGDTIDLDLCCDCFDEVFDELRKKCKHDPLEEN